MLRFIGQPFIIAQALDGNVLLRGPKYSNGYYESQRAIEARGEVWYTHRCHVGVAPSDQVNLNFNSHFHDFHPTYTTAFSHFSPNFQSPLCQKWIAELFISAVICLLRASTSGNRYVSTAEHHLRSKAKTLFSQWTSYFGQFDGPKLLMGIVQQANKDLQQKYKNSISEWIVQLPQTSTSMVELVISGNDGFLVTQRLLRDFFTSWKSVKWRLTVYSTQQKGFKRMEVSSLFVHWESPEREASPHIVEFTASLAPADEGRRGLKRTAIKFSRVSGRGRNALPAALSSSPSRHREDPKIPRSPLVFVLSSSSIPLHH